MARWTDLEAAAPDLAAQVRRHLEAHTHLVLATLRRDGSPRVSGTEVTFGAGDLWLGSMWRARKALDLRRDPRFALHSGSDDPPAWEGDAKLAGRAEEVTDPARRAVVLGAEDSPDGSHLFRLDLTEVSTVGLSPSRDALVVTVWTPLGGVRSITRS